MSNNGWKQAGTCKIVTHFKISLCLKDDSFFEFTNSRLSSLKNTPFSRKWVGALINAWIERRRFINPYTTHMLKCHFQFFACFVCSFFMSSLSSNRRHYGNVIMDTMASQLTSLTIVYSTVYSGADQRKHQSSASLAFVWGIHRGPVNSPYKWPVTRKMFPFDDVIMEVSWTLLPRDTLLVLSFLWQSRRT